MSASELTQTPTKSAQLLNGLRLYKRAIKPVAVKANRTDAMASPLLGRSNTLPTMTWAPPMLRRLPGQILSDTGRQSIRLSLS